MIRKWFAVRLPVLRMVSFSFNYAGIQWWHYQDITFVEIFDMTVL